MSLIERIDAMDIAPFLTVDMNTGYQQCIRDIKQIILSKQKEPIGNTEQLKEPCEYCHEDRYDELVFVSNHENTETYCGVWIDKDKLHQEMVVNDYYDYVDEIPINFCPICGRPLNQPYADSKIN